MKKEGGYCKGFPPVFILLNILKSKTLDFSSIFYGTSNTIASGMAYRQVETMTGISNSTLFRARSSQKSHHNIFVKWWDLSIITYKYKSNAIVT